MIFDYVTLQVIWWVLVGAVLILYATTAGFDFGVTMLLPFMNRHRDFRQDDVERRVMLNTISATWDGNQTWLVFAGGALFVVWPVVYTTVFSGVYAGMLLVLFAFFLRPPGFDYRSKIHRDGWRKMWDWALFLSAFLPIFAFGLVIGNLFVGLPFHFSAFDMRSFYDGNFFDLLNPFGIVCGLTAVAMALTQGCVHLNRRTRGELQDTFRRLYRSFGMVFLLLMTIAGIMLAYHVKGFVLLHSPTNAPAHPLNNIVSEHTGAWFNSMQVHTWKWIPVIVAYAATLIGMTFAKRGNGGFSFWLNSIGIAGTVAMFGATLFPFLVPSSIVPDQSITAWNATSAPFTLMGMFYIGVVLLLAIFAYKFWGYYAVWRKNKTLGVEDIHADSHTYY